MAEPLSCELCGDTGTLVLGTRCHPSAPLRVELLESCVAVFYCYIPECNREVARFKAEEFVAGEWKCGCGFRMSTRTMDKDLNVGPPSNEAPACMKDGKTMSPLTWRESALEMSKIAEAAVRRATMLEREWPEGFAIPVDQEEWVL